MLILGSYVWPYCHTAICFNCYQSYQVWHCSLHPRFLDRFSHIHRRQHSLARLYQTVFPARFCAAARIVAVDRVLDLHAKSNRSLTDTEECQDSDQPRLLNQNIEDVNQSIAICISYMISIWFQFQYALSSRARKKESAVILRRSKFRLRTMTAQVKSVS